MMPNKIRVDYTYENEKGIDTITWKYWEPRKDGPMPLGLNAKVIRMVDIADGAAKSPVSSAIKRSGGKTEKLESKPAITLEDLVRQIVRDELRKMNKGFIMSSEYQLKLALAQEIELALKWQARYDRLTEEFSGLLKEFLRYCERYDIHPQRDYELCRLIERIKATMMNASPGTKHFQESPEDEAIP